MTLRCVHDDDIKFVFDLANEPDIRRISFCSDKISWETHQKWFTKQIYEDNPFYIIHYDGSPCGYIRIQQDLFLHKNEFVITIAITQEQRKKGIATLALRAACKKILLEHKIDNILAFVKKNNTASHKLFINNSWKKVGTQTIKGHTATCFTYPGYME